MSDASIAESVSNLELASERRLSKLIDVPVKTLQGQRLRGDGIPFVKIGRLVRYRMADVQRYLEEHTCRSTVEVM